MANQGSTHARRTWMRVLQNAMWVALLLIGSCDDSVQCHLVECLDSLSLALRPADHTWEPGSYTFEFTLDGDQYTCKAELSDSLPDSIEVDAPELSCSPRLSARFSNTACSDQPRNEDGGCASVQDRWFVYVEKAGTPKALNVSVQRDDASIFVIEQRVTYPEFEPNGPGCGVCRQQRLDFEIE